MLVSKYGSLYLPLQHPLCPGGVPGDRRWSEAWRGQGAQTCLYTGPSGSRECGSWGEAGDGQGRAQGLWQPVPSADPTHVLFVSSLLLPPGNRSQSQRQGLLTTLFLVSPGTERVTSRCTDYCLVVGSGVCVCVNENMLVCRHESAHSRNKHWARALSSALLYPRPH